MKPFPPNPPPMRKIREENTMINNLLLATIVLCFVVLAALPFINFGG